MPVLPPGGAPARAEPGERVVARFRKPSSAAAFGRPSPGRAPARVEPGERVVAQFRKSDIRRDLWPSFRRVVPRPGPSPARGSLRDFANPRPPRPLAVLPRVVASPVPSPARAEPGGRVVAQFRKSHIRSDLWPSFPGSLPRPCRARREEPAPAGGLLRNFAKSTRAPAIGAYSPHPAPKSATRPCGTAPCQATRKTGPGATSKTGPPRLRGRCALGCWRRFVQVVHSQPVPALRAKRHSALPCSDRSSRHRNRKDRKRQMPWRHRAGTSPPPARMIGVHRRQESLLASANRRPPANGTSPGPRTAAEDPAPAETTVPAPHSSPAAAAARDAGVSISSGATGPVYVYPKNSRRSGLVMFSHPGYFRAARSSGTQVRA